MSEEIEASYLDSSSVRDSKEGGLEEAEEIEDGVGEGGQASILIGTPLPIHLGASILIGTPLP